tara:strand:- start:10944 stop:11504 length:561 start_codon:yes stop_codon:yes gene_type:complete
MAKAEEFELSRSPGQLLHRAQQFAAERFASAMPHGEKLTQRQFAVLAATADAEGLNQSALVKTTGIDRSTLAELVKRMADNDYLTRETVRGDARAKSIRLTDKGRTAYEAALEGAMAADTAILDSLSKSKRAGFLKALKKISQTIEDSEAKAKADKKKLKDAEKKAAKKARKAAKKAAKTKSKKAD